jgi:thymidylate kinase
MDKGRLIAIEGTPGAGKTTVCDRLRNDPEKGFTAYFAPVLLEPPEWSSEQKYQQLELIDKMDRWYLAEDERRARSFRSYLASGTNVIQDRSFLSTLCFAFARSAWLNDSSYFETFEQIFVEYRPRLLVPDIVINLLLSPTISMQRIATAATPRASGPWTSATFVSAWNDFTSNHARSYLLPNTIVIDVDVNSLKIEDTFLQLRDLLSYFA